ncbi:MAG: ornithine carbamoyltransferase [Alphaproteobacteria bacterium]|nr:ornithine carbamoyltransferase [Alphaproteobacteria bacterium]
MSTRRGSSALAPKHFLDIDRLDAKTLRAMLDHAHAMKKRRANIEGRVTPDASAPFAGRVLAMLFERPSTRTRVSFQIAMAQLGGETILLRGEELQLGRGETVADTARVLSRYCDAIMVRASNHQHLIEMAEFATVPVVNGLTDRTHPCQVMADVMTIEEKLGPIRGKIVAWCGACNNMAQSWIHAAVRFGFELRLACPAELQPTPEMISWATSQGCKVSANTRAAVAVRGADCVTTDTWVSMSDNDGERRKKLLAGFQVTRSLLATANAGAMFLHCLPAHRGEEVEAEVIDGPQSAVWDEAENRVYAQKAILAWCLG